VDPVVISYLLKNLFFKKPSSKYRPSVGTPIIAGMNTTAIGSVECFAKNTD
jgi:hypothetical protein